MKNNFINVIKSIIDKKFSFKRKKKKIQTKNKVKKV